MGIGKGIGTGKGFGLGVEGVMILVLYYFLGQPFSVLCVLGTAGDRGDLFSRHPWHVTTHTSLVVGGEC